MRFPEVAGSGPFAHSLPYTCTHFLCRFGLSQSEGRARASPRGAPVRHHSQARWGTRPASGRAQEWCWEPRLVLLMWPFLLQRIIKYGSNFHYGLY